MNIYIIKQKSDEKLNKYILSDKSLKQFPKIKYKSFDIRDYF
jgi:hypothetical protein